MKKIFELSLVVVISFMFMGCTSEEYAMASGVAIGTSATLLISDSRYNGYYAGGYYNGRYYNRGYYRGGRYYTSNRNNYYNRYGKRNAYRHYNNNRGYDRNSRNSRDYKKNHKRHSRDRDRRR